MLGARHIFVVIFSRVIAVSRHASYFFKCITNFVYPVLNAVLWIRNDLFRIQLWIFLVPDLDLDPGKSSRYMRIGIWIHNTGCLYIYFSCKTGKFTDYHQPMCQLNCMSTSTEDGSLPHWLVPYVDPSIKIHFLHSPTTKTLSCLSRSTDVTV